jgi:hypothetical protein
VVILSAHTLFRSPSALSPLSTIAAFLQTGCRLPRTSVIDVSIRSRFHSLEQLINFIITHLLAQISQDVSQLTNANETRHVLVKDLEATAVFFWLARVAEAAWAVENLGECFEIDCKGRLISLLSP